MRSSRASKGTDAEAPLMKRLTQQEQKEIEDLEDIGEGVSTKFTTALQMAVRAAFFACCLASIVWIPALSKLFPPALLANLPFATLLFLVIFNPLLGQTLGSVIGAMIGTTWASLNIWLLRGFFPGGVHEGSPNNSSAMVFGYVDLFVYIFLVLACNCGLGMKMFALATHVMYMLEYMNPKSTAQFSDGFAFNPHGTAVNRLLAIGLACLFALVANLLPYPMRAARAMRDRGAKAAEDTSKLFEKALTYYSGTAASVVIESQIKHSLDLRATIDDYGTAVGAAWFEGFDFGSVGTVRAHMSEHLALMNSLYDRLRALLIATSTEDFGDSHQKVMDKIKGSASNVVKTTARLLKEATEASGDGHLSEEEKNKLKGLIQLTKDANKDLSKDFDKVRRTFEKPISADMLSENFFVLTLSAYSRLVWQYAEQIMAEPPAPTGLFTVMADSIKSTWDVSAMTERIHRAFFLRYFLAIGLCWFYSVYVDSFGGGCVITSVFLMKTIVGPDLQMTANVIQAVICAIVVVTIMFSWTCSIGFGPIVIPIVAFIWWTCTLYIKYNTSQFSLVAAIAAVISAFKLVGSCPSDTAIKSAANAAGIWGYIVGTITALSIVATCELLLAVDRNSNLAVESYNEALLGIKKAFSAFWANKDTAEPMGPVAGLLDAGAGYSTQAAKEPRFWRNAWKGALYDELVGAAHQVRLDLLMLRFACQGSTGNTAAMFKEFHDVDSFMKVKKDLTTTLEDAHKLSVDLISHESGPFDGLQKLLTETNIDQLEDLPELIEHLSSGGAKFPEKPADLLEDDQLCQLSTVIVMLDSTVQHIAAMIKSAVRNA